jgi:hypothetical protein
VEPAQFLAVLLQLLAMLQDLLQARHQRFFWLALKAAELQDKMEAQQRRQRDRAGRLTATPVGQQTSRDRAALELDPQTRQRAAGLAADVQQLKHSTVEMAQQIPLSMFLEQPVEVLALPAEEMEPKQTLVAHKV